MHVLILNQTFHPDVAATGQLMWDLARHLVARGDRVTVATSRSFYGTDRRHEHAYENIEGVEIHRLGGTAFGKRNIAGRLSDFASFYLAAGRFLQSRPLPDVILALTSPPMVSTLAAIQKRLRRRADGRCVGLVYHVMDLYPDAAVASGMMRAGGALEKCFRRVTARTIRASDAVIALGRDMRERIIRNYEVQDGEARIHVVQPWADGAALRPAPKSEAAPHVAPELAETFNVVYSGNLGVAHDLETLVGAVRLMQSDPATVFIFIGGGKRLDDLRTLATSERWPHVRFLPFQDRERLVHSLNLADVHLVSQLPAFTGVVVPSKLFGVLAVGKPAVVVGPTDAECSRIVAESNCGYVTPNGDAALLAQRLRQLRDDPALREEMGRRARATFDARYDQPIACERIRDILHTAGPCG